MAANLNDLVVRKSYRRGGQTIANCKAGEPIGIILHGMQMMRAESARNNLKALATQKSLTHRGCIPVLIKSDARKTYGDIGRNMPVDLVTRTSETCADFRGGRGKAKV